jgi:outer membrane murein-binding lipoprotein Lpp
VPTPTDRLAVAIKGLEGSIDGLNARIDRLDETIRGMGKDFADFRGSVKTELAAIPWLGVFFASILVAVVVGAGHVVWDASAVTSDVKQLSKDSAALASEVKQLSKDSAAMTSKVDQLSSQVERIDGRLDTWADKVSKQLDILIQHTQREAPKRTQGGTPAPASSE